MDLEKTHVIDQKTPSVGNYYLNNKKDKVRNVIFLTWSLRYSEVKSGGYFLRKFKPYMPVFLVFSFGFIGSVPS